MAAADVWPSPAIAAASPPAAVPIVSGASGLTGRPRVRPVDDDRTRPVGEDEFGEPVFAQEPAPGLSLPGGCLRALTGPRPECQGDCPGRQRDGGCLADVIRENPSTVFRVDAEGYWVEA